MRSVFGLIGFGAPLSAGVVDLFGNGNKWNDTGGWESTGAPLSAGVVDLFGNGNKWNDTDGWESTFSNSASNGRFPWPSLLRVVIFSAIKSQAARSALRICVSDTAEYPGGGG